MKLLHRLESTVRALRLNALVDSGTQRIESVAGVIYTELRLHSIASTARHVRMIPFRLHTLRFRTRVRFDELIDFEVR